MSEQSETSPLQENLAEEEEVQQQEEDEDQQEDFQEASQEPPGGDERKVATLPPSAQKTSIARKGPVLKPCAANAMGLDPMNEMICASLDSLAKSLQASRSNDYLCLPSVIPSKRPFENSAKDGVSQGKQKMIKDNVHGKGEGVDGEGEGEGEGESEGPVRKSCAANAMSSDPMNEMLYATLDSLAKSLQISRNNDYLCLPSVTPAKRPFENSAKDGVSQGKQKMIKDKVHGEDGDGEGEGEGEENPRDDSASI